MFNSDIVAHLDSSTGSIRAILERATARIEAIKPGEKIPATKLAEDLAEEMNLGAGAQLYPTLKFLLKDYPGVWIKRGAQGGIYRPTAEELAKKASDDAAKAAAETK